MYISSSEALVVNALAQHEPTRMEAASSRESELGVSSCARSSEGGQEGLESREQRQEEEEKRQHGDESDLKRRDVT